MMAVLDPFLEALSGLIGSLAAISTASAAIVASVVSVRMSRRRAISECDQRIAETWRAFREGLDLADQRPKRRKKMVE